MLQATPPREYVIEKTPNPEGGFSYVAYWRDHAGTTPFWQRQVLSADSVVFIIQLMTRHYPGATCVYVPEDVTAIIADAIRAIEGNGD